MHEFKTKIMQNFDILINYYKNTDSKKSKIYADMKHEYFEKIDAYNILPEPEKECVKSIEEVITSEMEYINKVENNEQQ